MNLVDTNVILDVFSEEPVWHRWSSDTLSACAGTANLAINPVIFSEGSLRFETIKEPGASRLSQKYGSQ